MRSMTKDVPEFTTLDNCARLCVDSDDVDAAKGFAQKANKNRSKRKRKRLFFEKRQVKSVCFVLQKWVKLEVKNTKVSRACHLIQKRNTTQLLFVEFNFCVSCEKQRAKKNFSKQ